MTPSTGVVAVLVAVGLVAAGCGDQGGGSVGTTPGVSGTTYVVTGVTEGGAPRALVDGTQIRLRFEDDRLVVTAGCNTISGRYRLDGVRLRVEGLSSTDLGCDASRTDQDAWIARLLRTPVELTTGAGATLTSGSTVLALADRRVVAPDRPLAGTFWVLDTIIDGKGATSVPSGVAAYLRIRGGTVDLYDGCNGGSGPVRVSGDRLAFGDRIQTLRACLGERGTVANALASLLRGPTTYRVEERTLTITRGEGTAQFRAVDSEPTHD